MNRLPANEALQRRANIALISAFFVFLWLPTADTFLHLDHAMATDENRALAEFPKYKFHANLRKNGEYLTGLQRYFNDHFGFRRRLVRWEHQCKWTAFHDLRSDSAIAGKSDWLFYSDRQMVFDLQGRHPFSGTELANWQALLTGRRDWLAQRGIRYLFVVPPDKHSIYPEYLPDWLLASVKPRRRIDQFFAYMKAHSDVPVLDLRDALLESKPSGRLYMMTDTHWNDRGAFAAYGRMMVALAEAGIRGKAWSIKDFEQGVKNSPGGDLALTLRQKDRLLEKDEPYLLAKATLPLLTCQWESSDLSPGLHFFTWRNAAMNGRLLVFRDSFMNTMAPFLAHSFQRVALIWQQNWDKGLIEREKPDIVIDEMVERFLIWRDPVELKKADEQIGRHLTNLE